MTSCADLCGGTRNRGCIDGTHHQLQIKSFFAHALIVVDERECDRSDRPNQALGDEICRVGRHLPCRRTLHVHRLWNPHPAAARIGHCKSQLTPTFRTKKSIQMTKIRPRLPLVSSILRDMASKMPLFSRTLTGTAKDHIRKSRTPGTINVKQRNNTATLMSSDIAITPNNWVFTRPYESITLAAFRDERRKPQPL